MNTNRVLLFTLSFIVLFSISFNFMQKSAINNEHAHHEHDSLFHNHEHIHLENNSHSHYHSTNSISLLDYFYTALDKNHLLNLNNNNIAFGFLELHSSDLITKLFKPPKIS